MRHQRAEFPLKLDGLGAARDFFAGCFEGCDPEVEYLWVAHVDTEARCVHLSRYVGGPASAPFPMRSIITDVAAHGTAGLLLAHNHPSDDCRPSYADCQATRRLVAAADALDCQVIDHLVFSGCESESFRKLGLL